MKKKMVLTVILLVSICSCFAWSQDSDDLDLSITVDASVFNKYIWRGLILTDGYVFQPALSFSMDNVTLSVWGNMDLEDGNGYKHKFSEIDYTGDYSFSAEGYLFSVGFQRYTYPYAEEQDTTEVYVTIGLEGIFNPSVTWFRDIGLIEGSYFSLSLSHALELKESDLVIDLAATLGYGDKNHNGFYYSVEENLLTDILFTASTTVPVTDELTFTPLLGFAAFVDEKIKANFENESVFVFGFTISYGL